MFDLWLWDLFSINMADGVKPSARTRLVRLWHVPSNKITCKITTRYLGTDRRPRQTIKRGF